MMISEVLETVICMHPPMDNPNTVDTVKCGDPDAECTGVVVTCYASPNVIRKAAKMKANLVIVHEPSFYNDTDDTAWLDGDPIYESKAKLLGQNNIVIWRNHDRIHGGPPSKERKLYMDGIFFGIMKELGWEDHYYKYPNMPLIFRIPERSGSELAQELMEKLHLTGMRIVGDLDTKVRKLFSCMHVRGHSDKEIIQITADEDVDALIPLEIVDWTLSEYVRDSVQLGRPRVILEMGHFNLEELGMKYLARELSRKLIAVPVFYEQSGDSFSYI